MIGISKLYCGTVEPSDALRYGRRSGELPSHLLQFSEDKKPVVVWNVTQACNLKCIHCYARAADQKYKEELTHDQALKLIDELADFGVPVILFSGGEPFMRTDLVDLARHTVQNGMRAVISTNGTLINRDKACELREIGLSYVGVSLDGIEEVHDHFRGKKGAFREAMDGIKNCKEADLKVGLRFTMNRLNVDEMPKIFDLIEEYDIPRACFYHLVYAGRGTDLVKDDLDHSETRKVVDLIIERTKDFHDRGMPKEILTVDNHADGPYVYLRMLRENNPRAGEVLQLLKMNEGNSSGRGIGCISWDGKVHADQFWRHYSFGNVLERPFGEIWSDLSNPLMAQLKDKKNYIKGRCAKCKWLDVCAGNFRVRAEAVTGDIWGEDPACYLTDEEIR
ncbi:MAG: 12,18-didecarboxysiroheme deacetylase [Desulfobacteraceae bacterium 4484_190.1]|nr:MAG: 12,18-didecarboxysiroheme deacetylase [Desulfobacteraceae bacterium 4484_190.1]